MLKGRAQIGRSSQLDAKKIIEIVGVSVTVLIYQH